MSKCKHTWGTYEIRRGELTPIKIETCGTKRSGFVAKCHTVKTRFMGRMTYGVVNGCDAPEMVKIRLIEKNIRSEHAHGFSDKPVF